jgi:hypothetical protein
MAKKPESDQNLAARVLVDLSMLRNQVLEAAATLAKLDSSIERAEQIIRGTTSGQLRLTVTRTGDRRRVPR